MGASKESIAENCECEIKNISERAEIFLFAYLGGVNFDASAWKALAGEVGLLSLDENDLAIDGGMNRKVAAHESARASNFRCASLADENFTSLDLLATKTLDAKSLAGIVV